MTTLSGILTDRLVRQLVHDGAVQSDEPIEARQYQPASLDARLGNIAYRIRSSFVPGNRPVETVLDELLMYPIDLEQNGILEKNQVYLVPLMESLRLPPQVAVRANPKSTTGRLDMLTRVITDANYRFDDVRPGYHGKLYLEIVPKSFTVRVMPGLSLNQLRFLQGDCMLNDDALRALYHAAPLLYDAEQQPISMERASIQDGLLMSVDLCGEQNQGIIGYKAKKNSHIVDLSKIRYYDAADFWEPIYRQKRDDLILEPEEFHLLCSQEKIRIPPEYSAEMMAYDIGAGEFRVHYAGFFDPGFGYGSGDIPGTYAVLEVRSHEVPYRVSHGQPFCKLQYARNVAPPETLYGEGIQSNYQQQRLALSKQFKQG
ncbi:2'-deoxycytidine 5'-triphosphate deaminase [Candidatus Moduliflexus flocculans]|uniref:2'-deoxycytidine 5'-triphosphate deaminase n=1 Tax=Candidatus Moduliflexus flocculans TaxID=1499966 RepID=A0A0S6VXT9_9BACT|nr:2'-deoxycytidine 5'-triphosphate deaminase [Candidatus Moduliflexus flocculans]